MKRSEAQKIIDLEMKNIGSITKDRITINGTHVEVNDIGDISILNREAIKCARAVSHS